MRYCLKQKSLFYHYILHFLLPAERVIRDQRGSESGFRSVYKKAVLAGKDRSCR
jgi:hypothetical protein